MKTIDNINNIPLHYARLTNHPYGTRGIQREFQVDSVFLKKLKSGFTELFNHCPLGVPKIITTAGIFVDKPGQHGAGRAFDLDAIFWKEESLVTLNFTHQKMLYLGIESFLRKNFGLVLNHFYPNHKDHWHIDISVPVDYNTDSQTDTLYIQLVLKHIYNKDVLVDGVWGRQTKGFINETFERLKIKKPITTIKNYKRFLEITGKIAFEIYKESVTPLELLDNLADVIEDLPFEHRMKVQEALNSFTDHQDTSKWLLDIEGNSFTDLDNIIDNFII